MYGAMKTKNTNIHKQIRFTGKLEKDDVAKIFFIVEKQQNNI